MRTVHKFAIEPGNQRVVMKRGARPIFVAIDAHGQLCVWAEINTIEATAQERLVRVIATGLPIPFDAAHVGSVVDGPDEWHVYFDGSSLNYLSTGSPR